MDFIRTPTPPYAGQKPNGVTPRERGLLEWFASFLRTPTPQYKTRSPKFRGPDDGAEKSGQL